MQGKYWAVATGINKKQHSRNIVNGGMVVKATSLHLRRPGSIPQGSEIFLTSCQKIGVCRQRDRRDTRLCADNCDLQACWWAVAAGW